MNNKENLFLTSIERKCRSRAILAWLMHCKQRAKSRWCRDAYWLLSLSFLRWKRWRPMLLFLLAGSKLTESDTKRVAMANLVPTAHNRIQGRIILQIQRYDNFNYILQQSIMFHRQYSHRRPFWNNVFSQWENRREENHLQSVELQQIHSY